MTTILLGLPATSPKIPDFGVWRTSWPLFEIIIDRTETKKIGIRYVTVSKS